MDDTTTTTTKKRPRDNEKAHTPYPTPAEERTLQKLWLEASYLSAASALFRSQHKDKDEDSSTRKKRRVAHAAYLEARDKICKHRNITYDPNTRKFVDAFPEQVDGESSRLFYQYFPTASSSKSPSLPPTASNSVISRPPPPSASSPRPFTHTYTLRTLHPDTKRNRATQETLERYLIRRYRGVFPQKIGVILTRKKEEVKKKEEEERKFEWIFYNAAAAGENGEKGEKKEKRAPSAAAVGDKKEEEGMLLNKALLQAMKDKCDILLLWEGAQFDLEKDIDLFYPAFPVLYMSNKKEEAGQPQGLLLTPLQAYQLKGYDFAAETHTHAHTHTHGSSSSGYITNLLQSIRALFGAVLLAASSNTHTHTHTRLPELPRHDRNRSRDIRGFSLSSSQTHTHTHTHTHLEDDANVFRVSSLLPRASTYIPPFGHGWLATDTAILLALAVCVYAPVCVLELGSWYGLSSRFILRESDRYALTHTHTHTHEGGGAEGDERGGNGHTHISTDGEDTRNTQTYTHTHTHTHRGIKTFLTVDIFKNTGLYNKHVDDITPMDKLYMNHLRFDTFYANLEEGSFAGDSAGLCKGGDEGESEDGGENGGGGGGEGRVVMIRGDIHAAVDLVHRHGQEVDMVFIDAGDCVCVYVCLLVHILPLPLPLCLAVYVYIHT